METSFVESSTIYEPLLNDIGEDESGYAEDRASSDSKQKKSYNYLARRKVEEYLEMKNLKQQTYDFFIDDTILENG